MPVSSAPDEEDDEDDWEDEIEEVPADDDFEADPDAMVIDTPAPAAQPHPNAPPKQSARESHAVQKATHQARMAAKPHSSLLIQAKHAWSLARRKTVPSPAERQADIQRLMGVIRGHVKEVVFKHDASRIVQTVVKYGSAAEREEVVVELKGSFVQLAQSRYSKFLTTKLVRLCPAHRASILSEFQGSVLRLLLHREASSVLADAFELYSNAYERSILLRDFYGKEAALFAPSASGDVTEAQKEQAKKGLRGVLESLGADEEQRKRVVGAVKTNLVTLFNNEDKGAVTHAVVHHALWEYLDALEMIQDEAERDKGRREIFEMCQDVVAELVHTKDGSRVVREFLARGSAKDRKQILKVLKPHIERMCTDDEAQLVLFTALDVVDDTKLLAKSLISSITTPTTLNTLCKTSQGRRSILYLIVPRTTRHFTPALLRSIGETDAVADKAGTSKKERGLREAEVRGAASPGVLEWVEEMRWEKDSGAGGKKVIGEVVRDPGGSLVVAEVMLYADGDKSAAMTSLLSLLSAPPSAADASSTPQHLITIPHVSRIYKTLLQGGHFSHQTKTVVAAPADRWSPRAFAKVVVETLGEEGVIGLCVPQPSDDDEEEAGTGGEGCFIVAELIETVVKGRSAVVDEDEEESMRGCRKSLKGWFGGDVKGRVEGGEAKGKRLLLEKVALL